MSSPTLPPTPVSFLSLPPEIRLMIYDFLLLIIFPGKSRAKGERSGPFPIRHNGAHGRCVFHIARPSFYKAPEMSCQCHYSRQQSFEGGFLSLRITNHQIYQETTPLIYFNPIYLEIFDTITFRDCSQQPEMLNLVRQPWLKDKTTFVKLEFSETGLPFDNTSLASSPAKIIFPSMEGLKWGQISNWLRISQLKSKKPGNLKQIAEGLLEFPNLKNIIMSTDSGDLFEVWSDPLGDFDAFRPLLEKGVHIAFYFISSRIIKRTISLERFRRFRHRKDLNWHFVAFKDMVQRHMEREQALTCGTGDRQSRSVEWSQVVGAMGARLDLVLLPG